MGKKNYLKKYLPLVFLSLSLSGCMTYSPEGQRRVTISEDGLGSYLFLRGLGIDYLPEDREVQEVEKKGLESNLTIPEPL